MARHHRENAWCLNLFDQIRRRFETQFLGSLLHRQLNGLRLGEWRATIAVKYFIRDTQTIFVLGEGGDDANFLGEFDRANVLNMHVHDRPQVTGVTHFFKKRLDLDASLYTLLQILSVTLFEKMPIHQALAGDENRRNASQITNQLNLFDF